jgi:hypothetical protein
MTAAAEPVARLHAVWDIDPAVGADFALMPDGRILRRFDSCQPWTHEGDAPAAEGRAALLAWLRLREYSAAPVSAATR